MAEFDEVLTNNLQAFSIIIIIGLDGACGCQRYIA